MLFQGLVAQNNVQQSAVREIIIITIIIDTYEREKYKHLGWM